MCVTAHDCCASPLPTDSLTLANTVANEGPLQWPKLGRGRKTRVYHLDSVNKKIWTVLMPHPGGERKRDREKKKSDGNSGK